ncbi:MAG: hypothetical protein U0Z75_08185 [Deinococcaceae bacterium]
MADFLKGLLWNEETLEYRVLNEIGTILKDAISAFSVLGAIHTLFSSWTYLGSKTGNLQEYILSTTPVFSFLTSFILLLIWYALDQDAKTSKKGLARVLEIRQHVLIKAAPSGLIADPKSRWANVLLGSQNS